MQLDKLLLRAARITWRHRSLWVLGLLATVGGLLLSLLWRSLALSRPVGELRLDQYDLAGTMERVLSPTTLIVGVLVIFVAVLSSWLLSAIADGGLIVTVREVEQGRPMRLVDSVSAGVRLVGRFIGIDTILFLPLSLLALALMLVGMGALGGLVFAATRPGAQFDDLLLVIGLSTVVSLPILLLMLVTGAIVLVLRSLAFRAAALEGLNTGQSIRRSWFLLRKKVLAITLLALVLWALRSLVGMPLRMVTLILMAAGLGQYFLTVSNSGEGAGGFSVLLAIAGLVVALISGVVASVMHAYGSASWTLAYGQWVDEPV
ncbi:MAG: hypothetical protein JSW55_15620 [Chloroflexota bacterium]|nr:MAG: hypothetical protein JSW55_15620 [Chloroflexota bacterium]